jgi:Protein of unknown function (DUF2865)
MESNFSCRRRRGTSSVVALTAALALTSQTASAQGLFDFLFGGSQIQQQRQAPAQANFLAPPPPHPVASAGGGSGPAFCVRSCDGRYFPVVARGGATPVQICQAFCPASPTRVFFGRSIDGATSGNGERYADSENAFAYRKALKADCTCNGRDPAGLAPIDLTMDTSLRPGDVIATTSGLVAYSGVKVGANQTTEFIPVSSYPGLTPEVRARLGEIKVAPASADLVADEEPLPETSRAFVPPVASLPKSSLSKANRVDLD